MSLSTAENANPLRIEVVGHVLRVEEPVATGHLGFAVLSDQAILRDNANGGPEDSGLA